MRKLRLALLAVALLGAVAASTPALARGHGGSHHGHRFRGFRPGFAVGALVAPAYVYPYPAPV